MKDVDLKELGIDDKRLPPYGIIRELVYIIKRDRKKTPEAVVGPMDQIVIAGHKNLEAVCNCSRATLDHWIATKSFPAWRIDGRGKWYAVPREIQEWFVRQRKEAMAKRDQEKE